MEQIEKILYGHQDEKYGDFLAKLVPTLPREKFIGIRSPEYKKILKEIEQLSENERQTFLEELPHKFHEENVLQVCMINSCKDFDVAIAMLEKFVSYIDNWAVSDVIGARTFEKNKEKLIPYIEKWINSKEVYAQRVAMLLIKKYFLDESFKVEFLEMAANIRSEEYYVNMMTAWLFADALVKQWDCGVKFIEDHKLDNWTHNKAIQKARESFRITDEQKEYLKGLKVAKV